MTDESFHAKLARAQLLRQQGRQEDAASFCREAIAANPEADAAFTELALCQLEIEGQRRDALHSIDQAVRLEPEASHYHAIRSLVLTRLQHGKRALEAADAAIALDPEDAFNHAVRANAFLVLERWPDAETAARQALAFDADSQFASNLLAMSLRLQGKMWENEVAVGKLLSDDPEDEMAHFNAGWAALQKQDYRTAEKHFLEALRLDPEFDAARAGLLESFKARSSFYRAYLRYCFAMQRFSSGTRWALIIGIYVAFRIGRGLLAAVHPVAATALLVGYLLFVFWVWLASGIGNFMILLDKTARHALKRNEAVEGIAVGAGLFGGILVAIIGAILPSAPLMILGGCVAVATLPASLTFTNDSPSGRVVFGGITAYLYLVGIGVALFEAFRGPTAELASGSVLFLSVGAIAALLCTWIGNIKSLRTGAET